MNIVDEIEKYVDVHVDHIFSSLRKSEHSEYYRQFLEAVESISNSSLLSTRKKKKSFLGKLQCGTKGGFNSDKYLQGVSEVLFWIYAIHRGYELDTDSKINPDNGTDVDVRISVDGCHINLEMKCPTQEDIVSDKLSLSYAYRVPGVTRDEIIKSINDLIEMIQPGIDSHPEMGYTGSVFKKNNDNKLLSFFDSAQNKFIYTDQDINALVISVPSNEMQNYYNYLWNPNSGILAGGLSQFGRKANEFDRIDVILLTNIVSGHDKEIEANPWDLSIYSTLIFENPYSRDLKKKMDLLEIACNVIPNDNLRFHVERIGIICRDISRNVPIDEVLLFEYLEELYPDLYKPDDKRIRWFMEGRVNAEIAEQK